MPYLVFISWHRDSLLPPETSQHKEVYDKIKGTIVKQLRGILTFGESPKESFKAYEKGLEKIR